MSKQFPKNGKKMLNDQAVLRAMSPRNTIKWVADLMGISLHAARVWVERSVPVYRREEFGLRLLEKYYAKRQWEDENVLPAILHMAGRANDVKSVVKIPGFAAAAADVIFSAQRRVEAAIVSLEADERRGTRKTIGNERRVNNPSWDRKCYHFGVWW